MVHTKQKLQSRDSQTSPGAPGAAPPAADRKEPRACNPCVARWWILDLADRLSGKGLAWPDREAPGTLEGTSVRIDRGTRR